ncbi:Velvet domain-containing protein [Fusarium sp. LHS14.1]|nr:Velvet domain-containing protein [Fusarium sp. LHS14.1]
MSGEPREGHAKPYHDRQVSCAPHQSLPVSLTLPSLRDVPFHRTSIINQQGYHVAAQPRISPPFGESSWSHCLHGSHSSLSHAARSSSFVNRHVITAYPDQQVLPAVDILVSGTNVGEHAVSSVDLRPNPTITSQHLKLLQADENHDTNVYDTNVHDTNVHDTNVHDTSNNSGSRGQDSDPKYSLKVRQQPAAARSCGFGERDRRMVDPPPILQLHVEGPSLIGEEVRELSPYPHYVVSCSICDESGSQDFSLMPEHQQQRRLMGSLVSASFVAKDEFDKEGCFFCFPDLSCRTPGSFRLKFSLVKVDPVRAAEVKHFPVLAVIVSNVFTVYTAKDFPGMKESTCLTKRLREQGCIIPIKKGISESKGKGKGKRCHHDLSDEEHEGEVSSESKRRL